VVVVGGEGMDKGSATAATTITITVITSTLHHHPPPAPPSEGLDEGSKAPSSSYTTTLPPFLLLPPPSSSSGYPTAIGQHLYPFLKKKIPDFPLPERPNRKNNLMLFTGASTTNASLFANLDAGGWVGGSRGR